MPGLRSRFRKCLVLSLGGRSLFMTYLKMSNLSMTGLARRAVRAQPCFESG